MICSSQLTVKQGPQWTEKKSAYVNAFEAKYLDVSAENLHVM